MTATTFEPAIPLNAPRNLALAGAVLGAAAAVRSPLGGQAVWAWLLLFGALLARISLGDRVRLRAYAHRTRWSWLIMALVIGVQLLDGNWYFAADLALMQLLPLSLAASPTGGERAHPLHHASLAAAGLLTLEIAVRFLLRDRSPGRGAAWVPFASTSGQEFLVWLAAVALASALIAWIDHTRYLSRNFRASRDHALRLKLAPHFIFNTLNTLRAQLERDPKEAGATVDRLAALYRQLLDRTERPATPLREELAFVEAYLGIEQVRLGGRLRVTIDVPEPLEAQEIPTLGLQTLVENAVKHGIATREDGGDLVIRVRRLAGLEFSVAVENPVSPTAGAAGPAGAGIGLETLRARLPRQGSLRTEARDGRFLAELRLPFVEAVP